VIGFGGQAKKWWNLWNLSKYSLRSSSLSWDTLSDQTIVLAVKISSAGTDTHNRTRNGNEGKSTRLRGKDKIYVTYFPALVNLPCHLGVVCGARLLNRVSLGGKYQHRSVAEGLL
jgi:hypothetical protein